MSDWVYTIYFVGGFDVYCVKLRGTYEQACALADEGYHKNLGQPMLYACPVGVVT